MTVFSLRTYAENSPCGPSPWFAEGVNCGENQMMDAVSRLGGVRAKIGQALSEASRPADSVTLVAVSKTFDADAIRPVIGAGQRVFGENRVQEAQGKWPGLKAEFPDIELHLIGPLQSNKAKEAVALFDVIETVDREKIAAELAKEIAKQGKAPKLYVQSAAGRGPGAAFRSGGEAGEGSRRRKAIQGHVGRLRDGGRLRRHQRARRQRDFRRSLRLRAGLSPARMKAYSTETILPSSHLNSEKLGEVRSPLSP